MIYSPFIQRTLFSFGIWDESAQSLQLLWRELLLFVPPSPAYRWQPSDPIWNWFQYSPLLENMYVSRGQNYISFPCCCGCQTMKEIRWKYIRNGKLEPGYFSVDFPHQCPINLSDRISANPSYMSDCFQTCICTLSLLQKHYS